MQKKSVLFGIGSLALATLIILAASNCQKSPVPEKSDSFDLGFLLNNQDLQAFGEKLFFDENLSVPEGQSCATCHGPETGWTGPDEEVNKTGGVYPGALHSRFGNRKPNSAAYATLSPSFHAFYENEKVQFAGGNFWDGRATGLVLGNPAADQAQGPFLNPVEQNVPDAMTIIDKVCRSAYASSFEKVASDIWGLKNICSSRDIRLQYGIIGIAIAAFEHSGAVNQFSSKFDHFLKGKVKLTAAEKKGLALFDGKAKCSGCHSSKSEIQGLPPLFTDFTFENVGIPANPQNPWYTMDTLFNPEGSSWVDPGLGGYLKEIPQYAMYAGENYGKHQVPTLRNVDKRPHDGFVKAFGHNGYFKSLEDIVHFYSTRDILPLSDSISDPRHGINCWPKPEVSENLNKTETGNLGLSVEEESEIVAFLKTLNDGYNPASDKE